MTEDKFLKSIKGYKKIGALTLSIITVLFGENVNLTPEQILEIAGGCWVFIFGQSYQDAQIERTKHLNQNRPMLGVDPNTGQAKF